MSVSKRLNLGQAALGGLAAAFSLFAICSTASLVKADDDQDGPPGGRGHRGKFLAERFENTDSDNDGKITYSEFQAAHEKQLKRRFEKLDANGDGSIDKSEAQTARDNMKNRFEEFRQKRGPQQDDQDN